MHETPEDLDRLAELLDRSYDAAGSHLREIITPERRLTAEQLCDRLQGMCLLVLATTTADGRPLNGPVDGFFYRGAWFFGTGVDALRTRHFRARPSVSASHVPEEGFSVTAHGRAAVVDHATYDDGGLRRTLLDYYGPEFDGAEAFLSDPQVIYARIDAERMFTFFMEQG